MCARGDQERALSPLDLCVAFVTTGKHMPQHMVTVTGLFPSVLVTLQVCLPAEEPFCQTWNLSFYMQTKICSCCILNNVFTESLHVLNISIF